jgi:hypothetical protein
LAGAFLNRHFASRGIFLAYSNGIGGDGFDFQLSSAPFRMPGEVGYIVEYRLQWGSNEYFGDADNLNHESLLLQALYAEILVRSGDFPTPYNLLSYVESLLIKNSRRDSGVRIFYLALCHLKRGWGEVLLKSVLDEKRHKIIF